MSKRLLLNFAITFAIAGLFTVADVAQTSPKGKGYFVHATVEQINDFAQSIRVKQERIPGYSEARIATYNVDDASLLKKLEVGDKIAATIYDKDDTLHDVQVVKIDDRLIERLNPK